MDYYFEFAIQNNFFLFFQEVISNFERNLLDLVSTFIENIQASFSFIRGFEWDFVEFLVNETTKFQNAIILRSDEPDFYISDELKQVYLMFIIPQTELLYYILK